MIDAVVLAGRLNDGPLRYCSPAKNEALIEINSRYMVEYVINALIETPQINKIFVIGLEGFNPNVKEDRLYYIPSDGTIIENVITGINKCKTEKVLITTSDIPLLTSEALKDFIFKCSKEEGDFYYPIVNKESIRSKFVNIKRTYVKIREGIFTGGNIFLVKSKIIPPIANKIQEFIDNRKSPLKLCGLIGYELIILYILHKLTIPLVENKVSRLAGIRAKAVIVNFPEIGIDVDKPSDLEIVSKYLTETCLLSAHKV